MKKRQSQRTLTMHPNGYKYNISPTIEMIEKTVKIYTDKGWSVFKFERVFGLFHRCISQLRMNYRELPVQYWHIFYEHGKKAPTQEWMEKDIIRRLKRKQCYVPGWHRKKNSVKVGPRKNFKPRKPSVNSKKYLVEHPQVLNFIS